MDRMECYKTITVAGNSLALFLTKELKTMDLNAGDVVKITIEKP